MTDPNKSTPSWNFGSAGTSGSSSSPFGQPASDASKPAGGLFGAAANPPATSGSSVFGGASPFGGTSGPSQTPTFGTSSGNNLFGGNKQPATPFGQPASQSNQPSSTTAPFSGFAGFSTPNKPAEPTLTGQGQKPNLFGAASGGGNTGGFFSLGSNASSSGQTSTTTPTSKPTTNFFANSTTPAGPPPNTNTGMSGANLFNQPATDVMGVFGKKDESSSSRPFSQGGAGGLSSLSFGGASKAQDSGPKTSNTQAPGIFGSTAGTAGTGSDLFGKKPAQAEGGLFQNLNKTQDAGASKPAASQQPQNEAPKASNLFNLGGQSAAGLSTAPTTTSSPFSFPKTTQPQSSTPANPVASPAAAPGGFNLFNNPTSSAASTPSTSAPLFPNPSKTQDKAPVATTGGAASTTAPSSTAPAPTSSLFNLGKPAIPAATSQAPGQSGTTAAQGAGTTNTALGASTAGPAPPAQSRLKNKTMDDIITRWASDLSKYQKEFQQQAEKVATWDRMLVENSEKIQKLYGNTLEAERATTEVERQLTAVESDQAELAHWLDYYEKEVDSMISSTFGQDGALSGPDQERERT